MAQYTCNANMASDLMPMLVKRRVEFHLCWPRPDLAVFESNQATFEMIKAEAIHLNMVERSLSVDMSKLEWEIVGDSAWPNLNLWEDATHQITFDGGRHWTNVIQDGGDPEYFVACSDGKTSWKVERFPADQVVKRPEYVPDQTATGRISDPQPQSIERRPWPHACKWRKDPPFGGFTGVDLVDRFPASVGEAPACSMTDTCFDSDPSEVGE